jgi:hypothetical protein
VAPLPDHGGLHARPGLFRSAAWPATAHGGPGSQSTVPPDAAAKVARQFQGLTPRFGVLRCGRSDGGGRRVLRATGAVLAELGTEQWPAPQPRAGGEADQCRDRGELLLAAGRGRRAHECPDPLRRPERRTPRRKGGASVDVDVCAWRDSNPQPSDPKCDTAVILAFRRSVLRRRDGRAIDGSTVLQSRFSG